MTLTLFIDGGCPLCVAEMKQLRKLDTNEQLSFVDIHAADFAARFPDVDRDQANRVLHGQLASGEMLHGLDVTCMAWSLVGKHRWLRVLRWPFIRPVADAVYLLFARHRDRISRWLTGRARCDACVVQQESVNAKQTGSARNGLL